MKKNNLFIIALLAVFTLQAQIETPQPSTSQKIEQVVGLTNVTIEYARPSMKGRKVFGDLVPFEKVWRTGANANTKITFSDDVMINGTTLKAGSYAIYTKPSFKSWEVYFYTDTNNWGVPSDWDTNKIAATAVVEAFPLPIDVETFTISIDDVENDKANLGIMWERTYVAVPIQFETDKKVAASIEKVMGGPSSQDYYSAAVYYLSADKDINKAKMWIDKAIEMREQPAFWYYRQQSLIYAKAGDKKGAIAAARKSLDLATQANNADYIALNKKSLEEWGAK